MKTKDQPEQERPTHDESKQDDELVNSKLNAEELESVAGGYDTKGSNKKKAIATLR